MRKARGTTPFVEGISMLGSLRVFAWLSVALGLAGVAACTIADSNIYVAQNVETRCGSQLGQYVLPKSVIHIAIDEVVQDKTKYNIINSLTQEQYPNNDTRYCFDYRSSVLSYDKVRATTGASGFLSFVSSDSADQSAYIIKTLIRAIFVGISQNPNFRANDTTTPPVRVADLIFDPFDVHETAAKNARLVELGFCLVLDGFTFRRGDSVQSYCNNPRKYLSTRNEYTTRYQEILDTTIIGYSNGVLYRPRVPYMLTVYTKNDPDKPGDLWRARESEVMELENISPFVAVRMDRVAFAVKRIGLVFSAGELKNACVYKSSEVKEAITIPLEIVKSVAALPTAMFQVQFDNVTNARQLAEAENSVIQAQIAYLAFLNKGTTGSTGGARPGQPTAETFGQSDASKFTQLSFDDSQISFWNNICNAPGGNNDVKTAAK
jgi:hypothetical protein